MGNCLDTLDDPTDYRYIKTVPAQHQTAAGEPEHIRLKEIRQQHRIDRNGSERSIGERKCHLHHDNTNNVTLRSVARMGQRRHTASNINGLNEAQKAQLMSNGLISRQLQRQTAIPNGQAIRPPHQPVTQENSTTTSSRSDLGTNGQSYTDLNQPPPYRQESGRPHENSLNIRRYERYTDEELMSAFEPHNAERMAYEPGASYQKQLSTSSAKDDEKAREQTHAEQQMESCIVLEIPLEMAETMLTPQGSPYCLHEPMMIEEIENSVFNYMEYGDVGVDGIGDEARFELGDEHEITEETCQEQAQPQEIEPTTDDD